MSDFVYDGQALCHAREVRGLTQRELARRARTTQAKISRLELGQAQPSLLLLARLAEALNVSAAELYTRVVRRSAA